MLALVFALPFLAALPCLALNRVVPTRWLGLGAAAVLLLAAALLLIARAQSGLPLALPERLWVTLDEQPVRLALRLDGASWSFALLQLGAGAVGLAALALAIPATLRGFGGLFAAALLVVQATLIGLANVEPRLLPFAWALAALLSFVALRVSGATTGANTVPIDLAAGLLGALLALAAALAAENGAVPAALVCWVLVALLAIGAPPFHAAVDQPAMAPAALAGLLLALGLPLLGAYTLMRFVVGVALPPNWRLVVTLLGLLTLLVCAAGAVSTSRMRRLIGWQFSAQMGLLLLAIGQGPGALGGTAPALLANALLTTLACAMAVAVLERRAGTDDLAEIGTPGPLTLPGLAFLVAAASAVGLPGTWGLWARRWLIDDLLRAAPWLVPPLLAGSLLMGLAYVAPLAAFWRGADIPTAPDRPLRERGRPALLALICPAVAALPLLIMGIAPQLAWESWLGAAQGALAPDAAALAPALPGPATQIAFGGAATLIVVLPFILQRGRPCDAPHNADVRNAGLLVPEALGQSLRGLIWLGTSEDIFRGAWAGLLSLSRAVRQLLALFEQRYYLAGLLIALIVVIMLLI